MKLKYLNVTILVCLLCIITCENNARPTKSSSLTCKKSCKTSKRVRKIKHIAVEFDLPYNFGKTNFIINVPTEQVLAAGTQKQPEIISSGEHFDLVHEGCIKQAYFAPDDTIQKVLLYLIEHEKKSIKIAA